MSTDEKTANVIWKELKKVAAHFFLGGGSLAFLFTVVFGNYVGIQEFITDWIFNGTLWVALGLGNRYIFDWLDEKMPWLDMPIGRTVASAATTIAYSVFVAFLVFIGFAYLIYGRSLVYSIKNIDKGFVTTVVVITILVSMFFHGRGFFIAWRKAIQEAEENKRLALSAQYESLKNQVNPHFLFNSFNVLSTLVYKDADLAARFIQQLTKVYRYVLETQDSELVPLDKELEVLDAYLFLLKIRFQDAIEIEVNLAGENKEDIVILPLTLQMLTENAIKHNIVSRRDPLKLSYFFEGNDYICIRNNLQLRSDNPDSLGVGLPNIQARYEYLGDKALKIEESETHFSVSIPIITLKEV